MSAIAPPSPSVLVCRVQATRLATMAVVLGCILYGNVASGAHFYPEALMNWMAEGNAYALIVDKSQQRLSLWRTENGEPMIVHSCRCTTGPNEGDKWVSGDRKTPEGIYFFSTLLDGNALPKKFGPWAFATDYPNFLDRRMGKKGGAIWLHGRDNRSGATPDSDGCIVLENGDLIRVSDYIRLQTMPLIVVDKLVMASKSEIIEQEMQARDLIETWRQALESRDVDALIACYSPNFQSYGLDIEGWRKKRREFYSSVRRMSVKLGTVHLYRYKDFVTAVSSVSFTSQLGNNSGVKVLHLLREEKYRIYAETYTGHVDDPFPLRSIRACPGAERVIKRVRDDLKVRLEDSRRPLQQPLWEPETPLPVPPSRGLALQKFPASDLTFQQELAVNHKLNGIAPDHRFIVASNLCANGITEDLVDPNAQANSAERSVDLGPNSYARGDKSTFRATHRWNNQLATALSGVTTSRGALDRQVQPDFKRRSASHLSGKREYSEENRNIMDFLGGWKWSTGKKDLDRLIKMYHPDFHQGEMELQRLLK